MVTFTGSTQVGKEILASSAKWVRKVILELGGHCPAILCGDAPWRELMPRIVAQSLKNSGQYCYRISRIYASERIYREVAREFARLAATWRVGPAFDSGVHLGPLNNPDIRDRVARQVEAALREGARLAYQGRIDDAPRGGFYYPPTVLTDVSSESSLMKEEIFGPVAIITPFAEIGEAIEAANSTPFGLAAYVFTKDLGNALECARQIEAGSVWINRIHQAYPQAPFGGMKESGLGREKSHFGIEEFTELKTIYLSY